MRGCFKPSCPTYQPGPSLYFPEIESLDLKAKYDHVDTDCHIVVFLLIALRVVEIFYGYREDGIGSATLRVPASGNGLDEDADILRFTGLEEGVGETVEDLRVLILMIAIRVQYWPRAERNKVQMVV